MKLNGTICFRCHYEAGHYTEHRADIPLKDIKKWVEAYHFTHPEVKSMSIRIWFEKPESED